jgi:DNA helicase-2/ATP-dependent DNA helicase PcrA
MRYNHGTFIANSAQSKAITNPPGPTLILAGAGTGKTTTLLHKIRYLILTRGILPENLLVLTFSEKAAQELSRKANELLENLSEPVFISTFHAFCNHLVRMYQESENSERLLIQENDILFLIAKRFDELNFLKSHTFRNNPLEAIRSSFIPFFNRIRDELLTSDDVHRLVKKDHIVNVEFPTLKDGYDPIEAANQLSDLIQVYDQYQKWKIKFGFTDYADMILDCWRMLEQNSHILSEVNKMYQHIIIDEYQDNNYALNKIMNKLASNTSSITVVGDEDQCIYSFRGANYYNITDFQKRYGNNLSTIKLTKNYRSTNEILNLANVSIQHDENRTPKALISEDDSSGPKPVYYTGEKREILSGIPDIIRSELEAGTRNFSDFAVLCRTWNQVKDVTEALEHAAIPVAAFTEEFFAIPIIKDILAWATLVEKNENCKSALYRIFTQYFGEEKVRSTFKEFSNTKTLIDPQLIFANIIKQNNLEKGVVETTKELWDTLKSLWKYNEKKPRADEVLWEILRSTDLVTELRQDYTYSTRVALKNMGYLFSITNSFVIRETDNSLTGWLHYMSILATDFGMSAIQPNVYATSGVQVMTVHRSKGLEFSVVLIPFLRSGSFPLNYTPSSMIDALPESWYNWPKPEGLTPRDEHINEERRIFYVAVTRAKEKLFILGPEKSQSRFVKEIFEKSEKIMEIYKMDHHEDLSVKRLNNTIKEKLFVELNHELSAHQYQNAHEIVDAIKSIELEGKLPSSSPYKQLIPTGKKSSVPETENNVDSLLSLSASAVEEYHNCPLKYRLNRIDNIPERKSKVQMEFGSIIHKVLEEFYKSNIYTLKNLLELLEKHWRTEAFEYLIREMEFKKQGQKILTDYYSFFEKNSPNAIQIEATFDFIMPSDNIRLTGKIDRIDKDGDLLSVTDYKTSISNTGKAKNSLQLALYIEAIKRNAIQGIAGKPGKAILHYLRYPEDPLNEHNFTESDWLKAEQKIKNAAHGIRRQDFSPKPDNYKCKSCDYRDFLCSAWENT